MEIRSKIVKRGNSFALKIPKALIDCKILEENKEYIFCVVEAEKKENYKKKLADNPDSSVSLVWPGENISNLIFQKNNYGVSGL